MDPVLSELLLVDSANALRFFSTNLGEVIDAAARNPAGDHAAGSGPRRVTREEFLYVSSILAHYAQVETGSTEHLPLPGTLRDLHDLFVTDVNTWSDPELMETAAVQALMLTGYFAGGMRQRHSLNTYVWWGRFFFGRAASRTAGKKHDLLEGMSQHFPTWRDHLERLHVQLWENRHLLPLVPPC